MATETHISTRLANLERAVKALRGEVESSPLPERQKLVSFGTIARHVDRSRSWVHKAAAEGRLKTVRFDGQPRVRLADAIAFLDQLTQPQED